MYTRDPQADEDDDVVDDDVPDETSPADRLHNSEWGMVVP